MSEEKIKKPVIISISNHKGGVGKTILATNLATYLLNYFDRVFVVDMDPQGNASDILCKENHILKRRVSDLLKYAVMENVNFTDSNNKRDKLEEMAREATVITMRGPHKTLSIITSSLDLTKTKIELAARESVANFKIKEMISFITKEYDIVIIDTPPSIELLTFSAIAASDYVIIPLHLDSHAVKGAIDIINDILPLVKQYYNPRCSVLGVVVNTHETQTKIGKMALPKVQEIFGDLIFGTKISRSVRVRELGIIKSTLDRVSVGTKSDKEFNSLTHEVYERIVRGRS
jgi:chromosome partitioning protein